MNKGEQVLGEWWDVLNKMVWLNNHKMKEELKEYKPSEVHCIENIGKNPDSNVTKLAEAFRMTTGALTKLTKKMMDKGLIESYKKPENKKEIYFKLTTKGEEAFRIHEQIHSEYSKRDERVFTQIPEEELECMLRFARLYGKHLDEEMKKLDMDLKSGCDKL